MRALIAILIGSAFSLLIVFGLRFFNEDGFKRFLVFAIVWLIVCIIDFFVVIRAGHSTNEELGIHAAIYLIPTIFAFVASRFYKP